MSILLLFLSEHPEDRGIRPHSLKVTTIDVIMGEIVKGEANLSQLAAKGNYRAATTQDMGKVYLRNSAQQKQIPVSKFAQKNSQRGKNDDSLPCDLQEFSEISRRDGIFLTKAVQGRRPADWDMSLLRDREHLDVLKKGRTISRRPILGNAIPGDQNKNGLLVSQETIFPR